MRLIKLSSDRTSFREVVFNRTGASFVIAEQRAPKTNRTKTYNGVGKTLILALLDFCLGSNAKPAFKTHLKGWTFYLTIEIEGKTHVIGRKTDESSGIWLDTKKISLKDLKEFLSSAAFDLPPGVQYLTFRSLLGRFIRFGKSAYTDYKITSFDEGKYEYAVMLRNAFLLGLDPPLATKKHELRTQQIKLLETMKQLDNDPLFSDLLVNDTVDIELTALKEQLDRLQSDLANFRVAENYHDIELEANAITHGIDKMRRESVKLEQAIAQIDRSIKTKADLPRDRVYQLYEEAQKKLPDEIVKTIDEVLEFQESLKAKRIYRLTQDRQDLEHALQIAQDRMKAESVLLDSKLRFLGEHRALDEYLAVSRELGEIQVKIAKLEESKSIRERAMVRQREIKLEMAEQNIKTASYFESAKSLIAEAASLFRSLAKRMYGPRKSGLIITSDDGENQQRYKIEAHIDSDAAEGISEARLFCYDLMLLMLGRGHKVQFLVHDSTLFGAVDPRQRLTMLQLGAEFAAASGFQYIATLNEHDVTSIESQVTMKHGEFAKLFSPQNVILRLSDDKPEKKLLGISVDMNYFEE